MWPPIDIGSNNFLSAGLSTNTWWAILAGCLIITLLCICALVFYCWIIPRHRKQILAHTRSKIEQNSSALSIVHDCDTFSQQIHQPPSYSTPSVHQRQCISNYQHFPSSSSYDINSTETSLDDISIRNVPETHRSLWVMNPVFITARGAVDFSAITNDIDVKYKTQSLPNRVKMKKSLTTTQIRCPIEDVHIISAYKNRRSKMRNDGAAIIAMSRSRSQHLSMIPCEREGVIIYNERTAL